MKPFEFSGLIIPTLTPFTDDMSTVSEVRLARHVRRLVESNPGGLLTAGSVGEFQSLANSERKTLLEIVIRESSNSIPVIQNITAVNTMGALDMAQHAKRHGARAVVVAPPMYGDYTQLELKQHFKTIANYCDLGVLVADDRNVIGPEIRAELEDHGAIKYVSPIGEICAEIATSEFARPDEFTFNGNAFCSTIAIFEPSEVREACSGGKRIAKAAAYATAIKQYGSSRIAKLMMLELDIEIGPQRVPLQAPPREATLNLVAALQNAEKVVQD